MAVMILGIDPGLSGAIALLEPESMVLIVDDMPVYGGAKGKSETNFIGLATMIKPTIRCARMIGVIEQVHAMPKQGVSSTFRFGENYGAVQMAVAGHGYETHYVTPAKWKKHFGLSSKKDTSRALATQRFPGAAEKFALVKDHGKAEAALLALYGAETILNQGG